MDEVAGGNQDLWGRAPGGGSGSNVQSTVIGRSTLNANLEGHGLSDPQVFSSVLLGEQDFQGRGARNACKAMGSVPGPQWALSE